ncbi:MAG TPA: helix-turn-helix domain-containing protein [Capsulimonadaceae bacterium]|jgi:hypothetical protein
MSTREELLDRLVNPSLTIEEAAIILDVDQKVVRRYSNSGVLPPISAIGEQRRFRLADVLAVMESEGLGQSGDSDVPSVPEVVFRRAERPNGRVARTRISDLRSENGSTKLENS